MIKSPAAVSGGGEKIVTITQAGDNPLSKLADANL